jgi:toxin-antitoxin system PIN domain toxin
VKLPDVNILLYASDEASSRYAEAHQWVGEMFSEPETVALAWVVVLGFLRISTNQRVSESPLTVREALNIVDGWLARPNVIVARPTDRHVAVLRELLVPLGVGGNLTTDAHLAALAIEHGAELVSCDADFSRFAGLRWRDPLR